LKNVEMAVAELLAKHAFIEHCKENEIITLENYINICNSWGDNALELIQHYLRRLDEYLDSISPFHEHVIY
jgi:hypothetical protein